MTVTGSTMVLTEKYSRSLFESQWLEKWKWNLQGERNRRCMEHAKTGSYMVKKVLLNIRRGKQQKLKLLIVVFRINGEGAFKQTPYDAFSRLLENSSFYLCLSYKLMLASTYWRERTRDKRSRPLSSCEVTNVSKKLKNFGTYRDLGYHKSTKGH